MTVKITTATVLDTVKDVKRIQYSKHQNFISLSLNNGEWIEYTDVKFIIVEN